MLSDQLDLFEHHSAWRSLKLDLNELMDAELYHLENIERLTKKDPLFLSRKDKKRVAAIYGAMATGILGWGGAQQATISQRSTEQFRSREAIVQPVEEDSARTEHGSGRQKLVIDNTHEQTAGDGPYPDFKHTEEYQKNLRYLSLLFYGEVDTCSDQEKALVFDVVLNRMDSSKFPNTMVDVITEKKQFSCFNPGNRERLFSDRVRKQRSYLECQALAERLLEAWYKRAYSRQAKGCFYLTRERYHEIKNKEKKSRGDMWWIEIMKNHYDNPHFKHLFATKPTP